MPIENRNLTPGTKLTARYHKQAHSAEVIQTESGKLMYRLQDGREFKSPSGAGMAITGHACDGWTFWNVGKTVPATAGDAENTSATAKEEASPVAAPPSDKTTTAKNRTIFRAPNQKGVSEGKIRWYCKDCGESFLADNGELPKTCPAGHQSN